MTIIDKAVAAERLVISAILMAESGVDVLAVHVVAASVLNVLRDLISKLGDDYVEQVLKVGAFAMAQAQLRGETIRFPSNPAMHTVVEKVAGGIKAGKISQASDLVITLDRAERRQLLDYIVKPYNFLKHADRDPLATLDESDIDAEGVIGHALAALAILSPTKELPEQIKPYLERHELTPASKPR